VGPGKRKIGRKGRKHYKWEVERGSLKGQEREERGGRGKMESRGKVKRGKEGSHSSFQKSAPTGPACRSVPGPRVGKRQPWPCVMSASVAP